MVRGTGLMMGSGSGPKTLDKKTVHKKESIGCGDVLIWFGGPDDKNFQGPHVRCPLHPNTRLLLAPMAIKPVSYRFLSSLLGRGK
jgi:hypothetical protein